MEVKNQDMGEYVTCENICVDNDALAAGTGDNTQVDGTEIDLLPYESGKIVITGKSSVNTGETLSFTTEYSGSTTTGGSFADDATLQAKTVVVTGLTSAAAFIHEVDVGDLGQYRRFMKFNITPDLSRGGTDICTWSAVFVGLKKSMS